LGGRGVIAEQYSKELEEKFRKEESKGWMYPTTQGVLANKYPGTPVLVAALGAIPKPDGTVRPIHDGTHYVQVNNHIEIQDQLQYPGPHEAAGVMRETLESKQSCFCISADIESAHRLVKIRECDHPLLACKADSSSKTIWVNTVGTFGISSAPFWWTRLFGIVGRMVAFIMGNAWCLQLVYVDDLHVSVAGEEKFHWLWMILAA